MHLEAGRDDDRGARHHPPDRPEPLTGCTELNLCWGVSGGGGFEAGEFGARPISGFELYTSDSGGHSKVPNSLSHPCFGILKSRQDNCIIGMHEPDTYIA